MSSYGLMGSMGLANGPRPTRANTNPWGLMGTNTSVVQLQKPQQTGLDPALTLSQYGVRSPDSSIANAVSPVVNTPLALSGGGQWGLQSRNSSITGDLAASQRAQQGTDDALTRFGPVNSGVMAFAGPQYNAVQQARMSGAPASWDNTDPRNSVLNAYSQPGLGGSMPSPPPTQTQQQPVQNGPYNGGAWTATGNPYSKPGTIMGQTVPMTPEIQSILAQGRVAGG